MEKEIIENAITAGSSNSSTMILEEELKKDQELLEEVTIENFEGIPLTPEQESEVERVKNAIILTDYELTENYGAEQSKKLPELSAKLVEKTRASEAGGVGEALVELATVLSTNEKPKKGIFGLFSKTKNYLESLQVKYESSQSNIDRVVAILEKDKLDLMKNNKDLMELKAANEENFQHLTVYVQAGRQKIAEVRAGELLELEEKAKSGNQYDVNKLTEFRDYLDEFEKHVHDLDGQIYHAQVMAISLHNITRVNKVLLRKINRMIKNMIPGWHTYMAMAFLAQKTKDIAKHAGQISDANNKLLVELGSLIRETTRKGLEEGERSLYDIETIEAVNTDFIASLQEISDIQSLGRQRREAEVIRINNAREELGDKLLQVAIQESPKEVSDVG